jgi:hypothetical protein
VNFKPIFAALADRMTSDLVSVQEVSRRNLPAKSFPNQPALVVLESSVGPLDEPEQLWNLGAILVLHARTNAADMQPGEQLLDLISEVIGALSWRAGEPMGDGGSPWTTLGGLALWARPEGSAVIEDDVYDAAQTSITIHVRMLVRNVN